MEMDPSTTAFSSSSSASTSLITTAQSVLSPPLPPPHQKSEIDIDDEVVLLVSYYMELEREHLELCRMALAFNSDIMAEAQAIHAEEIRITNRPRRKRKRKVGSASASLPPLPLPMNNLEVIQEEAPPTADDAAPPVK